ncbi:hypothetical protein BH10ACT1_BH10ACT1_03340 [soil metagenome]
MTDVEDQPLAVRTAPSPNPIRQIVVGTDGSAGSGRAVEWTAEIARSTGANVTAVHVLTPNQELLRDLSLETMHLWRRDLEAELRGPWVEPLRRDGVVHRCLVVEADTVADGLLQSANRSNSDLLVVSTRGRGRSATSHLLAHRAARPVVVVPSTWQPRPA